MSKRKVIISILLVTVIPLFLLINYGRNKYVVPILMYHSVNPQSDPLIKRLILTPQAFERQMRFLKEHKYNVLTLESVVRLIKDKKKIPPGTVAITFDDGYRDSYTYAFPILKKYDLPATMFIIVREVERPQGDRLSWAEVKEMQESGIISFGSHAIGPDPLIKIESEEGLKIQILGSKRILEEKLGRKVNIFSYPEGMFDDRIRQLVIEAGYLAAVATKAKGYAYGDIFALKRLRISEKDSNSLIFAVRISGFYTFMKERDKSRHGKK